MTVRDALCAALDDEYKARATYRAVIAAFGEVLPFAHIIESEQRHVDALLGLFAARGWQPPADAYAEGVTVPATFAECCRLGIDAEVENAALYDRLNALAAGDAEVLWVFGNLRRASAECHLPAFRRALEHPGGSPIGMGGRSGGCHCGRGGHGHHGRHGQQGSCHP